MEYYIAPIRKLLFQEPITHYLNACKCHPVGTQQASTSPCFLVPHYIVQSEKDKFFAVCFPLGIQMYNLRCNLPSAQIFFSMCGMLWTCCSKNNIKYQTNNVNKTQIDFSGTFACLIMVK